MADIFHLYYTIFAIHNLVPREIVTYDKERKGDSNKNLTFFRIGFGFFA